MDYRKELITVNPGSWRSATVFTHAIWNELLFYGGGSGSDGGDPRHEIEIGVFHLVSPDSGYHDPRNPIITRKTLNLDQPGKGITPLTIFDRGDSLFMFCTSRPEDDLHPRIVLISASVANPFEWGGYKIIIDQAASGEENNHGASVLRDPGDPSQILLYFAALSEHRDYRILLAAAPVDHISRPGAYHILNDYQHPVLQRKDGKVNYPFVRYIEGTYELWYSGHSMRDSNSRSCYRSTSKQKDRFLPAASAVLDASAIPCRNDNAYATGPKVHGAYLYYSGRKEARGNYTGIFCIKLTALNLSNK